MVVAELLTRLGFEVDPRELNRGLNQAKSSLQGFKSFLGKLALGVGFYEIGKHVVNMAAELETLNTQLHVMTGSTEKTQLLFKGIVDYAKTTAFYVKDVTGSVSTLLQGMVNVSDIMPKIKQLGDVAKDSGQLNRLAYAYAQVNRQGYMTNYEARRFQQGGNFGVFNQYAQMEAVQQGRMTKGQEIAKGSALDQALRARQGELFAMAKDHEFTVGMLDKALEYATTKGGMFFEHQKEQVKTFAGAWSNMWDVLNINAALAMQKMFPIFKGIMKAITDIPMDWLVNGLSKVSSGLQYIWKILAEEGLVEEFEYLKSAIGQLGGAWVELFTGLQSGGDTLHDFAVVLGVILTRAMMLVEVALWISKACVNMQTGVRYVVDAALYLINGFKRLVGMGWAFFAMVMVIGPPIGYALYTMWAAGTLGSLGFVKAIGTAMKAMQAFTGLSVRQLGWIGAAMAVLAIDAYILGKTLRENEELAGSVDRETRKAAIAQSILDVTKLKVKAAKDGRGDDVLRYQRGIDDLWSRYHAIGDEGKSDFQKFSDGLMASMDKTLKGIKDGVGKTNEHLAVIKGNTSPKGGAPNDVLRLADMSFRTHFDVQAAGVMLVAE
jgi:hypothetical protein